METAKVDIRKLQLLNDRISQTIDALDQVRMSVHGLQHSSVQQAGPFQSPFPVGTPVMPGIGPFGVGPIGLTHSSPQVPFGYGLTTPLLAQNPYVAALLGAQIAAQPYGAGLSHTSPESVDPIYAQGGPRVPFRAVGLLALRAGLLAVRFGNLLITR